MFEDDGICTKCGQVHTACSAHNRNSEPCRRLAMKHLTVCNVHGGHAKQTKRAAARREAASVAAKAYEADPNAVIAAQGLAPVADPILALGRLATSAEVMMARLGARLNYLEADELTWETRDGVAQVSELLKAYERAMDRTGRLMDLCVKNGFQERQLQLEAHTVQQFTVALNAIFSALALTPEQRAMLPVVVPRELKALDPEFRAQDAALGR